MGRGSDADIAVLQLLHGHFSYMDGGYARQDRDEKLETQMTVRDGAIVFDPYGLSAMPWQKARSSTMPYPNHPQLGIRTGPLPTTTLAQFGFDRSEPSR
jgi:hypothetical protein